MACLPTNATYSAVFLTSYRSQNEFRKIISHCGYFFFTLPAFQVYITTQHFRLLNQVAPASSGLSRYNNSDVGVNLCPTGVGI